MDLLQFEYEPDEILVDEFVDDDQDDGDDPFELSFEGNREAVEGFFLLENDVNAVEELFAI